MFNKRSCNMKSSEANVRIIIATLMLVYALTSMSIIVAILSIILYYTAFKRFCLGYYLFKINEKYSLNNYYLSLLPKHRPSPVFIFGNNGEVVFKNNTAENELSYIKSVKDIGIKKFNNIISEDAQQIVFFQQEKKY
jgi:hypothetical protein